jgi:hypothetical protein
MYQPVKNTNLPIVKSFIKNSFDKYLQKPLHLTFKNMCNHRKVEQVTGSLTAGQDPYPKQGGAASRRNWQRGSPSTGR